MAADLVQGFEDDGVDAKAVVQEGTCDLLDSLHFVRREKWCRRLLGGPLLCSLAVDGGCPVMRGVLWEFWGFVVEFIEGIFNVARHGDVEKSFRTVPGKSKATVLCPLPID